ncbi:MAG: alpha/beta fold hydrolase [Planctomycetes bacterium]|nr:alpha/beta fold hydrolase [Planctomycetota bacterium]
MEQFIFNQEMAQAQAPTVGGMGVSLIGPTLIVHGESDGLIPVAYADEFARLIPTASVVRIAGAGHLPMIEREDEFLERVEAFLAG